MQRIIWLSLIFIWLLFPSTAQAITDPRQSPNNRFGIHILEEADLPAAQALVNSNGDWGYVTMVMRFNDLNRVKWQGLFDDMRRRHLIPIVRLATVAEGASWAKPKTEDIDRWVEFLNSLNWVVANRYVILFNEPNHAKEWGREIKPQEYAVIAKEFSHKLKSASADFFILPAGLDTAAPNSADTMAATEYWRQMFLTDPEIFKLFDGWNSHSYPNPAFSGPISGTGLGTIRSYQAEINYLSRFGLPGNLPVFITETGWVNSVGDLSRLYTQAFNQVWQQPNLVAVTPFVLNYPQPPLKQFSWIGTSHYETVAALAKTAGRPEQVNDSIFIDSNLPDEVVADSDYRFFVEFTNTGQSIWQRDDFRLNISGSVEVPETGPGQAARLDFSIKTPAGDGPLAMAAQLEFAGRSFGAVLEKTITVVPPPVLTVFASRLFKSVSDDDSYTLLIYDSQNQLRQKFNRFDFGGFESIKLHDLIPGQAYRVVIVKPDYLPRQQWLILNKEENQVSFKPLLPFDFDRSGHLSIGDFWRWLIQPINYLRFRLQPGD